MKTMMLVLSLLLASVALADKAAVGYPEGYRTWAHVKSMLIEEGHPLYGAFGGLHHIYANKKALAGYKAGRFPDGSVIAFDLLAVERAGGGVTEAERKVLGVMQKDSKRFANTGGWGFEGFAGGDRVQRVVGANAGEACFACHAPEKEHDYVFSRLRD